MAKSETFEVGDRVSLVQGRLRGTVIDVRQYPASGSVYYLEVLWDDNTTGVGHPDNLKD